MPTGYFEEENKLSYEKAPRIDIGGTHDSGDKNTGTLFTATHQTGLLRLY